MSKSFVWTAIALAALFAASCQDENAIDRAESLTGLWTIEPSAAQSLVFQWEQDGSALRGEMYVESFLGTEGPFPLSEGRVSGGTVTWSIRPGDYGGTDSLSFRGNVDTPNVIRGNLTVCTEIDVIDTVMVDTTVTDTCLAVPVTAVRDASGF